LIVIVMGVLGAGKSTIGTLLAERLGWKFVDADSFHPAGNIEKMRRGIPLTDRDREPWLDRIHQALMGWLAQGRNVVLACSALKTSYRERLLIDDQVKLVYIKASYELVLARLQNRRGHFAGQQLVPRQFADLEEPKDAIVVDASERPEDIVHELELRLNRRAGP
jgi:gluconokinase